MAGSPRRRMLPRFSEGLRAGTLGLVMTLAASVPLRADEFDAATELYARGAWQEAADAWRRFVAETPDDPRRGEAVFYWAESLVGTRQYAEAATQFEAYLRDFPEHASRQRAAFRLGECLYLSGQRLKAWHAFREFTQDHPSDPLLEYALPYMGILRADLGDRGGAKQILVDALDKYPDGALADTARERLVLLAVADRDADTILEQMATLERTKPEEVQRPQWKMVRGLALQFQGQDQQAMEVLESIDESALPAGRAAGLRLARASSYRAVGKLDAARRELETLIAKWPDSSQRNRAELALAGILVRLQDHEAAETHLRTLLDRVAEGAQRREAQRLLAKTLLARGDADAALGVLKGLAHAPQSSNQDARPTERAADQYELAAALLQVERPEECLDALDAVPVDDLPEAFALRVRYLRGSAELAAGRPMDAREVLEQAAGLRPGTREAGLVRAKLVETLAALGEWHQVRDQLAAWKPSEGDRDSLLQSCREMARDRYEVGDYTLALPLYETLVAASVDQEDRVLGLTGTGWCHLKSGQWQASANAFGEVLSIAPADAAHAELLLARGHALEQLNRPEDAVACYREFLVRFPQQPGHRDAARAVAAWQQRRGDYSQATQTLETALKTPASDLETTDEQLRYTLACNLKKSGQLAEAEQQFARLKDLGPGHKFWAESNYRLAEIAFQKKDLRLVEQYLSAIRDAAFRPESDPLESSLVPYLFYLEGRVALDRGDWNEALASLDQLLVDFPDSPLAGSAQRWSAEALFRLEDYANAKLRLEAALRIGSLEPLTLWRTKLRLAQVLAAESEWNQALSLARELDRTQENPARAAEREILEARCLVALKSWQDARRIYERLLLTELDVSYRVLVNEQLQKLDSLQSESKAGQLPISTE